MATAELPTAAPASPAAGARLPTLAWLLLFVLTVGPAVAWVYRPLLTGGFFLSDDYFLLREATASTWRPWPADPWLLTGVRHEEMWRPLGLLGWRLGYWALGPSAPAFYALSVALHLVNAALVLLLARRLGLAALPAAVAGAVFALHPIAVESIGWLAARFDLQATLFALVALHCYLTGRAGGRWSAAAALAFAAALLSKESTIVLPAVALALDWHRHGWREGLRAHRRAAWPLWALAVLYPPLRLALLGALGSYGDYLAPTPAALLENLLHHGRMLLFVPYDADAYVTPDLYQPPGLLGWRVLGPLAAAGLLALLLPRLRPGLAIALLGLLPVLTISGGGRLVYFSLVGLALAAGAILSPRPIGALAPGWSDRARPGAGALGAAATLAVLALLLAYAQTARPRAAAWAEAGRLVRALPAMARALDPALPAGARVYVRGLPDHDREVYALRNVEALRFDVDAKGAAPPLVDAAAALSPRLAALVPVGDFPTALPPAEVCRARFAQLERGQLTWQPVPLAPSPGCAPIDDPLPAGARPSPYRFGEGLRLSAFALPERPARAGARLRLDLLWRAEAAPGRVYKTFVHVVGADGRLVAQRDAEPYGGRYPTAVWRPGTVLHDRYPISLPADLPPGRYGLVVGWYGVDDPARLPAFDGDRPVGDAVRLAEIEVAARDPRSAGESAVLASRRTTRVAASPAPPAAPDAGAGAGSGPYRSAASARPARSRRTS